MSEPDTGDGQRRGGRLAQLDGLRAVAVGAVFVEHWLPQGWALHRVLPWGAGVKLFFVLSGFLITGILLDCRRAAGWMERGAGTRDGEPAARAESARRVGQAKKARRSEGAARLERSADGPSRRAVLAVMRAFWARRFLRIFPAFYAVAIGAALLGVASARATLPYNLSYTTNFHLAAAGAWRGEVSHFWSLAVEEQFYLVWPWVVLLLPMPAVRRLVAVLVVAAPAFRLWAAAGGANPVAASVLPPACFDALGAGALLALERRGLGSAWFGRLLRPPFPALAVAAAVVLSAVHLGAERGWIGGAGAAGAVVGEAAPVGAVVRSAAPAGAAGGSASVLAAVYAAGLDLALAFAFAALVARAADGLAGGPGALLGARPMVYLGTISYGLYLLHNFVPGLIGWAPLYPWMRPLVYPFVTTALAAASWRWLEEPIHRTKRHFPYLRPDAQPAGRLSSPQPAAAPAVLRRRLAGEVRP
jgi:peptidoglycan/LPS O-acetylase OafA/YrhL